jgi:tetratricopeptide (TPR) repeat protein
MLRALAVAAIGSILGCSASNAGGLRAQSTWPDDAMRDPVEVRETPVGSYLAGQFAQRTRQYDDAAAFLRKVMAEEPENENLARQTFMLLALEGEFREASVIAEKLIAGGDNSAIGRYVVYLEQMRDGKWDAARESIRDIPDRSLHRFVGPFMEAWAEAGKGDGDEAMEALDPLSKDDAYKSTFAFHAAMVNDYLGNTEQAATYYAEAVAGPGGMTLRVVQLYGNFLERNGRRDEAVSLYTRMIDQHGGNGMLAPLVLRIAAEDTPVPILESPAEGLAEGLFSVGTSLRQQGSQDFGLIFGRMALELKPDFVMARLLVADVLERQDRLEEANRVYEGIPADSPFRRSADLNRAQNLSDLDRTDEAVTELERLAADDPDSYDALVALGNVLRRAERFEDAAEAFDRAIAKLGPERDDHWRIYYSRGIALERSKQWARAEKDFLKALDMQPEQPYVLNYLGYSWIDQGMHLARATEMIEKAVKLRPNDGAIVDSLGWALYRVGDYEGAVKQLERAVELLPHDPTINDHLGDAYWRVGRRHEARFQWQRALSLEPETDLIEVIEGKLRDGLKAEEKPDKDG